MKRIDTLFIRPTLIFILFLVCQIGFSQEVPKNQANQSNLECACSPSKFKVWSVANSDTFSVYDCTCSPFWVELKIYNRWGTTLATLNRFELRLTDFEKEFESGTYFLALSYKLKKDDEPVNKSMSLSIMK